MRLYPMVLGAMHGPAGTLPVTASLVAAGGGEWVLVDTGYRPTGAPDEKVSVSREQELGGQLARIGVRPEEIGRVVVSHFDPDHAGNLDLFPDAEVVVQRSHLAAARSGAVGRLQATRKQWDAPGIRLRTVDGDETLLPGIELIASGGHVPGHQSVLVRLARTGPVLLAADAIPIAAAADPEHRPRLPFDLDHEEARESARRLGDLAEREGALVIRGHDAEQWAELPLAPGHLA